MILIVIIYANYFSSSATNFLNFATYWYKTTVCAWSGKFSAPHFMNKPYTKPQRDQKQQLSCLLKTCFCIGLFHLARKFESAFTHIQGVFCGSFSLYQFAHGDVL